MKIAVISGSKKNFNNIVKKFKNNENQLFLWKPDFSTLASSDMRLPKSFGESVHKDSINKATVELHSILKNWYRDSKGNDLSIIENMSLGMSFESSSELMLYNACLTYLAIKDLSSQYDEFIIDRAEDNVKTFVCEWLRDNEGLQIKIVNLKNITNQSKAHPMLGFRDLKNHFHQGGLLDLIISKLLSFFQIKPNNLVFVMNSGKLDEYFDYKSKAKNIFFKLLLPISRNFKYSSNYIFFWKRFFISKNKNEDLSKILNNIELNGWNYKSGTIPKEFFKSCINNFTIPFWTTAIDYFNAYRNLFNFYKPKLALYGTDNSEIPIISAYAASSIGIPTMVMHHGIEPWGGKNFHTEIFGPFKYYAGIGPFDNDNFYANGVPKERIINANLPWFSQQEFKSNFPKTILRERKKVLLLPIDTGFSMHINANTIHNYILDMILASKECNLEIYGIKFRTIDELEAFGFKNGKNFIKGEEFHVFAGYGNLHEFFADIDVVIGPFNSATVECALANIDYYTFHDYTIYENNPNIYKSIKDVINVASEKKDLINNIKQENIFKDGFSVESLVNSYANFYDSCKKIDDIFMKIMTK